MLNAYTIKKILPRLLLAVILINLSYYIVIITIDVVNVLGDGIADLITLPFRTANPPMTNWDPGDLSKLIIGAVTAIAGFKLLKRAFGYRGAGAELSAASDGFGVFLLTVGLSIGLIILAIFIVLTIRLGLMVGLAIASPIAFAAMVLPGTEKWFKKWLNLFMTTLVIYPLVMAMFALGRVMTYIFGNIDGQTVGGLTGVFAVIAQFLPLVFIPFSFKLAGGAIGAVGNFITGKTSGIKSMVQGDERDPNSRINRAKAKRDNASLNRRLAGNERVSDWTNRRNSRLGKWAGSKMQRSVAGHDILAAQAAQNKKVGDEMADTIATGDDSQIRALTARRMQMKDGSYQWVSAGGKKMKETDVMAARQRWGHNHSAYQKALTYEMSKTNTAEEAAMVGQAFDGSDGNGALVEDWNLNDREAKGMWTGSAYANQNNRLEWKYMSWNDGANGGAGGMAFDSAGFATEVYEKKGSYQLSQMGSTTINALRQEHRAAQAAQASASTDMEYQQAAERIHRVESIASTMSMQARQQGTLTPNGEDGALIPTGSGSGAVNDEVAAFVNEVSASTALQRGENGRPRTLNAEDRIVMDDAGSMTGPTETPRAPGASPASVRPTVDGGREAITRGSQGDPHKNDPTY